MICYETGKPSIICCLIILVMFLTIYLTPSQLIFLIMIRPLGLIPPLEASAILLHPVGCEVHIASSQSCTAELWHGTGGSSILAFTWDFAPSHPAHFETTTQRLCHTAQHDTLPAFPLPDCAREKVGQGRGKGGAEGLNKTDQKALNFFPNTQTFND